MIIIVTSCLRWAACLSGITEWLYMGSSVKYTEISMVTSKIPVIPAGIAGAVDRVSESRCQGWHLPISYS
jgi:hypothetical protein